ncbi:MAG TPA: hypothetical protein VNI83_14035 [Vicinamibacterales bacterium]|nr:hypothetical protein [Vicinamibacterales bacterium]
MRRPAADAGGPGAEAKPRAGSASFLAAALRCDRELPARLRALDAGAFERRTKGHLSRPEIRAVLARRDLIVAHFERLIAEEGEAAVLY